MLRAQAEDGESPIHTAALHGYTDIVTLLLEVRASPHSALTAAAQEGCPVDLSCSLVVGSEKPAGDDYGFDVAGRYSAEGQAAVGRLAPHTCAMPSGSTALRLAVAQRHMQTAAALLAWGASPWSTCTGFVLQPSHGGGRDGTVLKVRVTQPSQAAYAPCRR